MPTIAASEGQLEALDALVHAGGVKAAADSSGLSATAVERRLQRLRARTGLTTVQLAYHHGQRRVKVIRHRQLRLWEHAD